MVIIHVILLEWVVSVTCEQVKVGLKCVLSLHMSLTNTFTDVSEHVSSSPEVHPEGHQVVSHSSSMPTPFLLSTIPSEAETYAQGGFSSEFVMEFENEDDRADGQ